MACSVPLIPISCHPLPANVVPSFRVYLLGPIGSSALLTVPQTRIRLFQGRAEFDVFLRETVLQAVDKIKVNKASCRTVIHGASLLKFHISLWLDFLCVTILLISLYLF